MRVGRLTHIATMLVRPLHGWLFLVLSLVAACDERAAPAADASAPPSALPPPPPPQREGCARVGALDAIEADPSCVVKTVTETAARATLKQLAISLDAEPPEVVQGGTSLVTLTIKNKSSSEATVYLEARQRLPGPRTDWSRVVGIPEPHPTGAESPRLLFPITTLDGNNIDVDALPTVAGTGSTPPPAPTLLAVHLRPNGKLTRNLSWWALRIPAPAPVVTDDAGHRYVPKTTAFHLFPGEYTVNVDVPFAALSREERKLSTRVRVTRAPLLDGGPRKLY